jgi:hypothetical protein
VVLQNKKAQEYLCKRFRRPIQLYNNEWLAISSNDPEKKNLNLEIFSTDIVEYISIDKVYGGSIYGDFAGNVDIISKGLQRKGVLKLILALK